MQRSRPKIPVLARASHLTMTGYRFARENLLPYKGMLAGVCYPEGYDLMFFFEKEDCHV
jgi:hypothetical protein